MATEGEIEPRFAERSPIRNEVEAALIEADGQLPSLMRSLNNAFDTARHGELSGKAAAGISKMIKVVGCLEVMIQAWREMYPMPNPDHRQEDPSAST